MESREVLIYIAKLAEQAKRYDDMVDAMNKVAKHDVELTVEERNLLSVGYENLIGSRRESWRILSSIERKEETIGNETNIERLKAYRQKVETEISNICSDIIVVIDEHLIPSASTGESKVFYHKMKGDYYRDLAEFKSADAKEEFADLSIKAYETAASVPAMDAELRQRFQQWMMEHERVYRDDAEKEKRFQIFKKNVAYIEAHNNKKDKSYTLGVNQFADLTKEEMHSRCCGCRRQDIEPSA